MTERSSTTAPGSAVVAPGTPVQSGWPALPWAATLFVVAPPAGRLVDRTSGLRLAAGAR